ncbi:MAG: PAS domain S-box protein [Rhodocyclaceae bacterium]|nr:PAS domain S-box protein [Rhodocyclaceae bacterium]
MSAENNILLAVLVVAVGLLSFAFLHGGQPNERDRVLRKWVLSAVAAGAGFLLIGLRGPLPDLLALLIGSLLLLAGFASFHDGVRVRYGLASLARPARVIGALVAAAMFYFALVNPSFPARVNVLALSTAAISFATAFLLVRHRDRQPLSGAALRHLLVITFVAAGIASVAVVPLSLAEPDGITNVRHASRWIQFFWTVAGVLNVTASVALGLILFSGIRRDLELSEHRLHLALEAANEGLWDWNLATDEIYLSPRYLELAGYRPGEVVADRAFVRSLVHPDDLERVRQAMENRLRDDSGHDEVEYRMLTRSGNVLWIAGKGRVVERDAGGRPLRYVGTIADISHRKAADERLRESEARYRFVAENAHDVIWTVDLDNRLVTYITPSVERLLGVKVEEIVGQNFLKTLLPESAERAAKGLGKTLGEIAAGQTHDLTRLIEVEHPHPDGRIVKVEMVINYVLDEAGHPVSLVGISRDITERKAAEAELRKYRQHLEELVAERTRELSQAKEVAEAANRAKSTFLANMSHELRTPLNAIIGMTGLALRRATDPKQADQLQKVEGASHHLLGIISDILDISKIEADRLELEERDLELAPILDDTVAAVSSKALAKGLGLETSVEPGLAGRRFRGDPERLRQVLLNLVGNAVKFTERGRVSVRVREAAASGLGSLLRFEVEDTGIGIPVEDQPRLFSAFEQADASPTRKYGGAGLGLAVSRAIVRLMGGEIGVESTPGAGSVFWFTVRLASGPAEPAAPPRQAEAELRRLHAGRRVLLAEDEPVNQEVSRLLLEEAGLLVDVADNGAQALDLARRNAYDLVLMDLQMPVMNGLDAARAIRALPGGKETPIVALTANAFDEDRRRSREAGMDDHVAKPIEPGLLFATVLRWLAARRELSA